MGLSVSGGRSLFRVADLMGVTGDVVGTFSWWPIHL